MTTTTIITVACIITVVAVATTVVTIIVHEEMPREKVPQWMNTYFDAMDNFFEKF